MSIYEKIGRRIKELREKAGMSQDALAKSMKLPRPAISQIESGARKISADELMSLSELFHVPVNDLLNSGKEPEVSLEEEKAGKAAKQQMRISVPQKHLKKFKEVLLYILNKVGAKENIGETVIYKLLYFIDFDFYEKYEEQLVGATYIKNKYGPTPVEFVKIVEKMIKDGEIEKVKSEYFKLQQTKYLPRRKPDLAKLAATEIEVIDDVLNRLSEMNASQISAYSHGDVPWVTTNDGDAIEYESVFYRTPPYSVRAYAEENG
ncbi:MAG TPA: type II toxin-antitoxin system antitoxin SocA domain-containing protein [Nitrospirota bacterium]|nr:type II toxin-antitoxin system antitoxin SocA domain-containing protein [Nitrospirota bacterium]